MTEPYDDARAEQAFRDALAQRAEELEPTPLGAPTGRGRWRVPLAVAASVVLAAVGLAEVAGGDDREPGPAAATATAASVGPGMRQVSFRDVVVSVPADWSDDSAPTSAWCVGDRGDEQADTSRPYVAHSSLYLAVPAIGCPEEDVLPRFDPQPQRLWVPHLQLLPAGDPDEVLTHEEWTLTTRTVGAVQLRLLTDGATTPLVDEIVASAQQVDRDHLGCATTSPAQAVEFVRPPAFDVAAVDEVSSLVICQYDRLGTGEPGLSGSRELRGRPAQELLEAIKSAPVGGGPDQPQNCADDMFGDTAVVLRLGDDAVGMGEVYAYYNWCFGNGLDDGTARRALTADTCRPLFDGRVVLSSTSGGVGKLCFPRQR